MSPVDYSARTLALATSIRRFRAVDTRPVAIVRRTRPAFADLEQLFKASLQADVRRSTKAGR